MTVKVLPGDCLDVLAGLPAESVDSVVTDPPYHFGTIVKRFGSDKSSMEQPANKDLSGINAGAFRRLAKGFMGKKWDSGDIAFRPETGAAVARVLKPGGHLLAFGAPKNAHRLFCAIEDAGFELRDCVMWLFGTGFPKSHNVAVAIDKMNGAPARGKAFNMKGGGDRSDEFAENGREFLPPYEPATEAAAEWQGWGTALKPAYEPIVVARKPLIGTVAENVLAHGTGALNIDGCRVEHMSEADRASASPGGRVTSARRPGVPNTERAGRVEVDRPDTSKGRWPANLIHDGSEEVVGAFPDAGGGYGKRGAGGRNGIYSPIGGTMQEVGYGDSGSAARFFYSAKAGKIDRAGSKHPTVKPVALMRYLCRLVTPPGGTVLDPFAGSGTTGQAAIAEGFNAILIEREAEYLADIDRRLLACADPFTEVA